MMTAENPTLSLGELNTALGRIMSRYNDYIENSDGGELSYIGYVSDIASAVEILDCLMSEGFEACDCEYGLVDMAASGVTGAVYTVISLLAGEGEEIPPYEEVQRFYGVVYTLIHGVCYEGEPDGYAVIIELIRIYDPETAETFADYYERHGADVLESALADYLAPYAVQLAAAMIAESFGDPEAEETLRSSILYAMSGEMQSAAEGFVLASSLTESEENASVYKTVAAVCYMSAGNKTVDYNALLGHIPLPEDITVDYNKMVKKLLENGSPLDYLTVSKAVILPTCDENGEVTLSASFTVGFAYDIGVTVLSLDLDIRLDLVYDNTAISA